MEADAVVIMGAGYNDLVCVGYLLKAGYGVLWLGGRSLVANLLELGLEWM